jgi:hypothetical protein
MDEEPPKLKLRSARDSLLTHILKRPTTKVSAIRYEDTNTSYQINTTMGPSNKRFKLFNSHSETDEHQIDASSTSAEPKKPKIPLIIRFYDPEIRARDALGRTLDDILAWDDMMLENSHNYIQMLFPLPEGSIFNMQAPVVPREVMEAFLHLSDLRGQVKRSWLRMLEFYGFMVEEPPQLVRILLLKRSCEQGIYMLGGIHKALASPAQPVGSTL